MNTMLKNKFIRLTKIQIEVLELLSDGNIIKIDKTNSSSIGSIDIASNTRYFLIKNRLMERKDKTKSIYSGDNGYIISEKGRNILNVTRNIKRRGKPKILLEEKKCRKCNFIKPISYFVSVYGFKNPRGKYCYECFLAIEQEHVINLMEGRDFCLYCGKIIRKAYDWTIEGKSIKTYVHSDHMDPLSLGGQDNNRNTVYCCTSCNRKKGNTSFVEWLKLLKPRNFSLAREIYIQKHKHSPEKFKPQLMETVIVIN